MCATSCLCTGINAEGVHRVIPETWLPLRGGRHRRLFGGGNIDLDTWELQTGGLAGLQGSIFRVPFHPEDSTFGTPRVRTSWFLDSEFIFMYTWIFFFHASAKEQLEDSKRNNCISSSIFLARLTIVRYLIEQGPNRKWPKYQALHLYTPRACFKRHII